MAERLGIDRSYLSDVERGKKNVCLYFVREGRKGGKLGGPARAAKMTPQERSESARKAVLARWQKIKGKASS